MEQEQPVNQKPRVFFESITFNDGTEIKLNHNSIVVFTGANNSGKSQVLRDAENILSAENQARTVVMKSCNSDFIGSIIDPDFLNEHGVEESADNMSFPELGALLNLSLLDNKWRNHLFYSNSGRFFLRRLSTEERLTTSNALKRTSGAEKNPIYKLNESEALAQGISYYFHQAFGVDLVVNRNDCCTIPLHVGKAPDRKAYTMDRETEYYSMVKDLPLLQEQGDGMRSFASILLDTFTSEACITLIDEPEAFLHPPQARILGKMLADNNAKERQMLISTHSEDFLQGLLDSSNENVTVIRIEREDSINRMHVLQNERIRKLWGNPILRYTNILSGLFHEKVIVCESDYDCLFYQAVLNAVYEQKGEIASDVLFTHCGGKAREKDVVSALKAVDVSVAAICDFDLLNDKKVMTDITKAFGLDWYTELDSDMSIFYSGVNGRNSKTKDVWERLKKHGKAGLEGDEPAVFEDVDKKLRAAGLFVVPVGEMEGFDRTTNKEKKEWVYEVLEKYDLATEPKLRDAREFILAAAAVNSSHSV